MNPCQSDAANALRWPPATRKEQAKKCWFDVDSNGFIIHSSVRHKRFSRSL